ncbi:hypothetical protein [Arthrobacter sp. CAN_A1]|uniref:hypothetical protein n=1 Tax=Arthrobacter sp. CAN_A1 TaxID=2787717 RepID=UPI0018C9D74A
MMPSGDPGWQIVVGTSPVMLFSLYLRDSAGLDSGPDAAGAPLVSPVVPPVPRMDPGRLVHDAGGLTVLRIEWETWWRQLLGSDPPPEVTPPRFPELESLPALQLLAHAHYGSAMEWSSARISDYAALARRRGRLSLPDPFGELIQERELELGRDAQAFTLQVVELPLSEPRAWFVEPGTLLMSQELPDDEQAFASYVRPLVELLA